MGGHAPYTAEEYFKIIQSKAPHITDMRGYTTRMAYCEFFDSRPAAGWFRAKPYMVAEGGSCGHPNYRGVARATSPEEIFKRVQKKCPYITDTRGFMTRLRRCEWFDSRCDTWFTTTAKNLLQGFCKGAPGMYKKPATPVLDVLKRIQKVAPHITNMRRYTITHKKCELFDSREKCGWFEATPKDVADGHTSGHPRLGIQKSKPEEELFAWVKEICPDAVSRYWAQGNYIGSL